MCHIALGSVLFSGCWRIPFARFMRTIEPKERQNAPAELSLLFWLHRICVCVFFTLMIKNRVKRRDQRQNRVETKSIKKCYKSIRTMLPFSGCMLRIDNIVTKVYQTHKTRPKRTSCLRFDYHENCVFDFTFWNSFKNPSIHFLIYWLFF